MTKPVRLPPVGTLSRPPLSKMEQVYLSCLHHWYAYKTDAPSLSEFAALCRRSRRTLDRFGRWRARGWPSQNAVRSALLSMEGKGYLRRNTQGRFEVIR